MFIKTKPSEFNLFVEYGRLTKKLLEEAMHLSRYPDNENVDVLFLTPSRAYVRILIPVLNGGNLNPTVTFSYDSFEYLENENLGGYFGENKRINDTTWRKVPAPLIYKINFKVYINTATPMDADVMQYQLLAYCRKNKPMAKFLDGQWIEWVASGPVDDAPIEPGLEDKIAKRSLTLSIRRAYLPVDFATYGTVEEINTTVELVEGLAEEGYTVTYFGNTNITGVVPIDDLVYQYGDVITVLDNNSLDKPGYSFAGWSTAPIEPEL
jgi:hypothetical protein